MFKIGLYLNTLTKFPSLAFFYLCKNLARPHLVTLFNDRWLETPGACVGVPAPPHHHGAGRAGLGLEAGHGVLAVCQLADVGGVVTSVARQGAGPAYQTWRPTSILRKSKQSPQTGKNYNEKHFGQKAFLSLWIWLKTFSMSISFQNKGPQNITISNRIKNIPCNKCAY